MAQRSVDSRSSFRRTLFNDPLKISMRRVSYLMDRGMTREEAERTVLAAFGSRTINWAMMRPANSSNKLQRSK